MSRHIPRLYLNQALEPGMRISLPRAQAHHLATVLRHRVDDPAIVFNGQGGEFSAITTSCDRKAVELLIGEQSFPDRESSLEIILGQGISRAERMDFCIQKAVELGVTGIQPLHTHHSQKLPKERLEKKMAHWMAVAQSAAEQSGRTRIPEIHVPSVLNEWLANFDSDNCLGWVLDPESANGLGGNPGKKRHYLLVGPESGLLPEEINAAISQGFRSLKLGPRILRTETAGLAAIVTLQTLWGDFTD